LKNLTLDNKHIKITRDEYLDNIFLHTSKYILDNVNILDIINKIDKTYQEPLSENLILRFVDFVKSF
jgi:hypothetical protein